MDDMWPAAPSSRCLEFATMTHQNKPIFLKLLLLLGYFIEATIKEMKAVALGMEPWVSGTLETILPASCIPYSTSILTHILLAGLGHATKNNQVSQPFHKLGGEVTHQILPAASSTVPCPPGHPSVGNGDVTTVVIVCHSIAVTVMGHRDSLWSADHTIYGALGCWF